MVEQSVRKRTLELQQGNGDDEQSDYEQKESGLSWKKFLRSKILNSDCDVIRDNPWLLDLGNDIRDDAVKNVLTPTKGTMTKLSKGVLRKFRMRYRNRKKLTSESIYLRPRWIHSQGENTLTIQWPKTTTFFTGSKAWKGPIYVDCRVMRTSTNDYYICIPTSYNKPMERGFENQDSSLQGLRICSLDPGVRTFQTVFDASSSKVIHVGDADTPWVVLSV